MIRAVRKHNKATVTIQDVAEATGVPVSTVSRVLNEKNDVAPETYQKVKAVIEEMGYAAAMMLVNLMRGHVLESNRHEIPTNLVIRDPCRAIGTGNPGSVNSA